MLGFAERMICKFGNALRTRKKIDGCQSETNKEQGCLGTLTCENGKTIEMSPVELR